MKYLKLMNGICWVSWLKAHLSTHRGAQRHSGSWGNPNNPVRGTSLQSSASRGIIPVDWEWDPSVWEAFWSTLQTEGGYSLRVDTAWDSLWDAGKSILGLYRDCTKAYYGMFRERTKGGDQGGMGKKRSGKTEGQWDTVAVTDTDCACLQG